MRLILAVFILVLVLSGFVAGVAVGHYKVFPYRLLVNAKNATGIDLGADERLRAHKEPRLTQFDLAEGPFDVVFVGDSITEQGLWSELFAGRRVANRGISGDRTTGVLDRLDAITALAPATAVLMLGINDIKAGRSSEEVFETYKEIVARLRDAGMPVVIQSTIQCNAAHHTCTPGDVLAVNELNSLLRSYADDSGITFADLGALSDPDGLPDEFTYDGVHLTGKGYQSWVEALKGVLSEL